MAVLVLLLWVLLAAAVAAMVSVSIGRYILLSLFFLFGPVCYMFP
jgi:hypothetical protein